MEDIVKQIEVNDKQEFMGIEIPVIEGEFGKNNRAVTCKTISLIHEVALKEINKSINRLINKNRMTENIDYIDLISQVNSLPMNIEEVFGVKQGYITRTKNLFLLSERGYTKLIKAMDDDKSWEVMDKFIDEYFDMRNKIRNLEEAQ